MGTERKLHNAYSGHIMAHQDWVPCPIHGRLVPYLKKRGECFCGRCGGWHKITLAQPAINNGRPTAKSPAVAA